MDIAIEKLISNNMLWSASQPDTSLQASLKADKQNDRPYDRASHASTVSLTSNPALTINPTGPAAFEQELLLNGLHEFISLSDLNISKYSQTPLTLISTVIANYIKLVTQSNFSKDKNSIPKFIVWIHDACWPAPFLLDSLLPANSDYRKYFLLLDLKNREHLLNAIDISISSNAVGAVVAFVPTLSFALSQRFALRAKKNNIFLLFSRPSETLHQKSAANTRWAIKPVVDQQQDVAFELELLSKKGSKSRQSSWKWFSGDTRLQDYQTEAPIDFSKAS